MADQHPGTGLRVAVAMLGAAVAGVLMTGCGSDDGRTPGSSGDVTASTAVPEGLVAYVDQSRIQRVGRDFFVRLVNDTGGPVRVTRAEVRSPRFDTLTWTGDKTFVNEADLGLTLPEGRCGEGSDAEVVLRLSVAGGAEREVTTQATDRYGAVGLMLDRDCGSSVLREAARLEVASPRIVGQGPRSVLEVPLRLVPTGERDDVVWRGLDDTVLFRQAPGSAALERGTEVPLGPGDPPAEVLLRVVPARCDPHALAEDKVGTLFAMRVQAPEVPGLADPYLPLDDDTRAALRRFVPVHCEWD